MRRAEILRKNPIPFFYRIVFLSNNYRDPLLRNIEQVFGLTRPEFSILVCLAQQTGISAIDISAFTSQPENTVSRGVFLLLEKGMIRKIADPRDKRRYHLHLTKSGERQYNSFFGLVKTANDAMVASLTPAELEQLDKLLSKMCDAAISASTERERS